MSNIIVTILLVLIMSDSLATVKNTNVVFIMYHRVGDARYASTNVTVAQFKEEMEYLQAQHYNVLPMPEIIAKLKSGVVLPDKTVGISFDDAFDTVYTTAWPILKKYHFPFTLFVATEPLDKHFKGMMTWDQVRELAQAGVTMGDHSVTHGHLATASSKTLAYEISTAKERIYKETGQEATLFAYPFGEYSRTFENALAQLGFAAAFTQITGAANAQTNFYLIPRIPFNEHYADFTRFKQLLDIKPLLMNELEPAEPVLKENPPVISFILADPAVKAKQITCYDADGTILTVDKSRAPKIVLRFNKILSLGRTRINCTARDKEGVWHWLGLLYINGKGEGE